MFHLALQQPNQHAKRLKRRQSNNDGIWTAVVKPAMAELETALDLPKQRLAQRRIYGVELEPKRLTVNDRDLATENP